MKQKKLPFFPLYPNDFLGDTGRLSTLKFGAYTRLLFNSWLDPLLDDIEELCEISRVPEDVTQYVLNRYFILEDGVWINKRLEAERIKAMDKHCKRSAAGKLGAKVKHGLSDATGDAIATQNTVHRTQITELITDNSELKEILGYFTDSFFSNMSIPNLLLKVKQDFGMLALRAVCEKVQGLDIKLRTAPYVRGIIKNTDLAGIEKGLADESGKEREWLTRIECSHRSEADKAGRTTDEIYSVLREGNGEAMKFPADHRHAGQTVWVKK